jgi:hypothetical protein
MQRSLGPGVLLVGLLLGGPAPVLSQASLPGGESDTAKIALIRQVIAVTRAADQTVLAIETSLPAQRAGNPRIPAVFWDRFAERARARRADFVELLVPIYSHLFSTAELRGLLEFYRGPLGQRLLAAQPDLTREAMLAGQQWGTRLGTEIGQELAAEGIQIQP